MGALLDFFLVVFFKHAVVGDFVNDGVKVLRKQVHFGRADKDRFWLFVFKGGGHFILAHVVAQERGL